MADPKQLIFISCGQAADEERTLGKEIVDLVVKLTPFEPYFADFQTSLQGVTQNIFSKLKVAAGFIAVMHHRGQVSGAGDGPFFRASVWVEQEIAIASFMAHTIGKNLHSVAFAQEGLKLEGVRKYIILNPKTFKISQDILNQLGEILPRWRPIPQIADDLLVKPLISYEIISKSADRHQYKLIVTLSNEGTKKVTDFQVDIAIPKEVLLSSANNACYVGSSRTHDKFKVTHVHQGNMQIYRGESKKVLEVDYFMNDDLFDDEEILNKMVTVTVVSDDMPPQTTEKPLRSLQEF